MRIFGFEISFSKHYHEWQAVQLEQCKHCNAFKTAPHEHDWQKIVEEKARWGLYHIYLCRVDGCYAVKTDVRVKPDTEQSYGLTPHAEQAIHAPMPEAWQDDPNFRKLTDENMADTHHLMSDRVWKAPPAFKANPDPTQYHDTIIGPCSCGVWHTEEDR